MKRGPVRPDGAAGLCRPYLEAPDGIAAPASNAELPPIGEARVSDILSELYGLYALSGTNAQRRLQLVERARRRRLLD